VPTYEYRCKACSLELEVVQSFTDDALTTCEACGGQLRKLFGNVGIAFKGSGFYKNDSRGKASNGAATDKAANDKGGSDTGSSDKAGADKGSRDAGDGHKPSSDSGAGTKQGSPASSSGSSTKADVAKSRPKSA